MMELLQLRYFLALAENEHLTKTAKQLMISPPSLSITIAKLEKELGVLLFDRENRSIQLNENGQLFYAQIKSSIDQLDVGIEQMHKIAKKKRQTIKIILTSPLIWKDFFIYFQNNHPNMQLETVLVSPDELKDDSNFEGFFMGNGLDITGDWESHQIRPDEDTLLLVSKKNYLAHNATIDLSTLAEETFITLGKSNPTSRHFVIYMCQLCGFYPKMVDADYFMRVKMLEENRGIVLTSELGFSKNFIENSNVVKIRVTKPSVKRYQVIAWKKKIILTETQKMFLNIVFSYFQYSTFKKSK